jgi:hypothetical protein
VARAALDTCPVCRRTLPDFGGWPAWCPECGWGVQPDATTTMPTGGFAGWWRGRITRAQQTEFERLLTNPTLLSRRHPRSATVLAAAVGVHLITLALLSAGAWVITTNVVTVLKVFAGVVAFGLVAVTFPAHRLRPSTAAKRGAAPTTIAVAGTVAEAVGVPAPSRVRVTSYGLENPPASRRVLTVDLDQWQLVGEHGRLALLAHELAHHNGHDPNRTMLVAIAIETLDGWLALLRPDPRAAARRQARRRMLRGGTVTVTAPNRLVGLSELLVPIVIAPLYGVVLGLGWVLREAGTAAGLRAELYADALAARAGGDVAELIDGELAAAAAAGKPATPLADLAATERERRRRLAVATAARLDGMHPTYAMRLEMRAAVRDEPSTGRVAIGLADMDAMTRELVALRPATG